MRQEIFNLIDRINRMDLNNSQWGVFDLTNRWVSSCELFGSNESVSFTGKILYVYDEGGEISECFEGEFTKLTWEGDDILVFRI